MTGCRGNISLGLQLGQIPTCKVELLGLYAGVVDATVGTPDVSAWPRPVAVNSLNTTGLSLFGNPGLALRGLSVDCGAALAPSSYVGDQAMVHLHDRGVTAKASFMATTVAGFAWMTQALQVNTGALALSHGPERNRVTLAAPRVQITNPAETDDNGIAFLDCDLRLLPVDGDDEFTLTFGNVAQMIASDQLITA